MSQGEVAPADAPAAGDAVSRAWALAARAARARYLGSSHESPAADAHAAEPTPAEVRAFVGADPATRLGATYAAAEGLRSAALRFDLGAVRALSDALITVAPDDAEAQAQRRAAELWRAIALADWSRAAALAAPLEAEAAAIALAPLVVEAAALRALALAEQGALDEALKVARRASRMARTEALPQVEYLAHWVLARVRRSTNAPHLATRILASLRTIAPAPWWPLLAWEVVLSGGTVDAPRPASALLAWVQALDRGAGEAFAEQSARLLDVARWPAHDADARAWISAVDPRQPPLPAIAPWVHGQVAQAPPALSGLLTWRGVAPSSDSALAYVLVDGPIRRRIPRLALALVDRQRVPMEAQSRLKQGRTEMLTAALALAPPGGLEEPACFASVYGFPYEPEVHKSTFDVLLHRAREHLAGRGTIVRGGGVLQLVLDGPLLAADPRCTRPLGDALLGALAEHAGASAKDVAKATGSPLRIVQATLQNLVKDGVCQQARDGREVRYVVEDTTYSEPTQRARASWA